MKIYKKNPLLKRALEIYKKNPQLVKNILKYYEDLNHLYKTAELLHSIGLTVGGFPWIAALPMIFAGLYYLMSSGTEIYRTIKEKKFQDETLKEQIRHNEKEEKIDKMEADRIEADKFEADKIMPFIHYNFNVPHLSLFKYHY